uniref:Ovule protein n=1 Tax=Elaeophora elaphi TaxID=1147741 RepID=A0A0R3RQ95_9BILA
MVKVKLHIIITGLLPLQMDQQNNCKKLESVKFAKPYLDTESSADEMKPLRNMSEESELSRSVMASSSSEQEDESGSQKKELLIKNRRHC